MLSRFFIIVLLLLPGLPVDATSLRGVIRVNEEGGQPMVNVGVAADGANPTNSDSLGRFTLEFPKKSPGDRVEIVVNQEGYVPVNEIQLQLALPGTSEDKVLTIFLCKESDREEMARRFYRLKSFEAIEETHRKRQKELEDTQQATAAALAKLRQERDQAKAAIEKPAEGLAKNQSGQSSELYEQAKRLFLDGKIEEALKLLDDEELRHSLVQAHNSKAEAEKAIADAVQAWLLKAHLFVVLFQFDDAEKAYLAAIAAAPDSFDANFNYARFNQGLQRFEKAKIPYERCLQWAKQRGTNAELADTHHNLGLLDRDQKRMEEARQEYEKALQIRRELAQKNPETFLPEIAATLNDMGNLDIHQHRLIESRKECEEALKIRRELAQKNPDTHLPDLADTLQNLGVVSDLQNRLEEAGEEYEEAMQIQRKFAQKNPDVYLHDLAITFNNLGTIHYKQKRLAEARQETEEALKTYRELAQESPETYLPSMAQTLNNLGVLDDTQNHVEEARQKYEEALQVLRQLPQKNLESYLPDVAATLRNLGNLDSAQKRMEEAHQEHEQAWKIYRELAQKDPASYRHNLEEMLIDMGRPIPAAAASLLDFLRDEWPLVCYTAGFPIAVLVVVRLFSWRFRRSVSGSMRKSLGDLTASTCEPAVEHTTTVVSMLVLRRVEVQDVEPATGREAVVTAEAEATTRATRFAYTAAAVAYSLVNSLTSLAAAAAHPNLWGARLVALIYTMQWVPLFILVWSLGCSVPLRLAIFAGYLAIGLSIAPLESHAATFVSVSLAVYVLYPMGFLLLLARPLRPLLLALVAILAFYLAIVVPAWFLIPEIIENFKWTSERVWFAAKEIVLMVVAVGLFGWILRRRRWQFPVAGLGLMTAVGLLADWLLPPSYGGAILVEIPIYAFCAFVVWLLFKLLVLLQEQHFLPAQLLQSHVCWGFLTIYLLLFATLANAEVYGGRHWVPWAIALAFALYLSTLHWLSRRIWAARVSRPAKRLLFLRVFGSADKRERLFDELGDTWRRVGRIDFIAGTDLVMRTLGSRMLEDFLLRRTSEQFLKTDAEVDRRLEHLHSQLEGDARYPVNPVYCYESAWQRAVTRLAPDSDAVLMDLRGFKSKNQGCVFELGWVVQRIPLPRVILLTDASSDDQGLEEVAQAAWVHLPCDSPNAALREPVLTILNAPRWSKESSHALFRLLVRAAYS